jgi:predicted hotdog family 3-hydroxylacyl-ACP dehydratase
MAEPSGHPEGAQAPEGSPTIRGGCLASARQDKVEREDASLPLGRTRWSERMPRFRSARQGGAGGCLASARQDNEGQKGLLRAEPSGHPEGAQAPEGSPTIRGGCLASARQDKVELGDASLPLGRTDGVEGLLRGESLSGHPEGAKAPEGSHVGMPRFRSARQLIRGCLASAR